MKSYSDPGGKSYTRKTGDEVSSSDYPSHWVAKKEKTLGQQAFDWWSAMLPPEHYLFEIPWEKLAATEQNRWEVMAKRVKDLTLQEVINNVIAMQVRNT